MVLVVKNPSANAGEKRRGFDPWVEKSPSRRAWKSTPLAHRHTTENHQWLNSKVYFMLQLQCRSAVKGYSLQSLRDLGWEDPSWHMLLRGRDRELKGFHSGCESFCTEVTHITFNWPKQIMWSPQNSSFSLESLNVCEWLPHTDRL